MSDGQSDYERVWGPSLKWEPMANPVPPAPISKNAPDIPAGRRAFRTRCGVVARLNIGAWQTRSDFTYLGILQSADRSMEFAWAWHADGTSIDKADRQFDLIDFPHAPKPALFFWLGREAE